MSSGTFGGIDWELGFAVYEIFWRFSEEEVAAFWDRMPRTGTWTAVLARAVNLYQQYRPREGAKIQVLLTEFDQTFEKRKRRRTERALRELYRDCLATDLEVVAENSNGSRMAYLKGLLEQVEAQLAE